MFLLESEAKSDVTELLGKLSEGDPRARNQLFAVVYQELRRLAYQSVQYEPRNHTGQVTALVHEAFLRLADSNAIESGDRKRFFVIAAQIIRRILVDHARGIRAAKRAGGPQVDSTPNMPVTDENADDILVIDEALARLETVDPRKSRVVELRYFTGFGIDETASILGVDSRTIKRDWQMARAWLHAELAQ